MEESQDQLDLDEVPALLTASDYLGFRTNQTNYTVFLDKFVRQVVGARKFDKWAESVSISQFVRVSDEACALLMHENQEHRWRHMLTNNTNKCDLPGLCTDGGKAKENTGRSHKAKGWSNKGINRFNALCKLVQTDRKGNHAAAFERDYQIHWKTVQDRKRGKTARKRKAKHHEDDENVLEDVFCEMEDDLMVVDHEDATSEDHVGPVIPL